MRVPPYGLQGGQAGATFRVTLDRDGVTTDLAGKANLLLRQGDLVTIETCGGGGYGGAA
jgi:N-methylhydantoinase B